MAGLKRKVFYLPGFDPRGGRYYYDLYREQAERYAAVSGHTLAVSPPRRAAGPSLRWTVANESEAVATDYTFLVWDDLVRRVWVRGPVALLARGARAYADYARHGDWRRAWRLPRGPITAFLYPLLSAVVLPLVVFAAVLATGAALGGAALALLPAIALAGVAAWLVMQRLRSMWILRFIIFNSELARDRSDPEIPARLRAFAALIAESLSEDWDEVVLVAHSNGSMLALPVVEELARLRAASPPDRFALVTLGGCLPLFALHRAAHRYHATLRATAALPFRWIDIAFPPDGACYAKVPPFAPHAARHRTRLQQLSPQFFRFWPAADYALRVRNKYQLHFDYLRCGETLSPIDHLSMTAGPRPLAQAVADFQAAA